MRPGVDIPIVIGLDGELADLDAGAAGVLGENRATGCAGEEVAQDAFLVQDEQKAIFARGHIRIGAGGEGADILIAFPDCAQALDEAGGQEIAAEQAGAGDELVDGEERVQCIQLGITGDIMQQITLSGGGILLAVAVRGRWLAGHQDRQE